MIGARSGPVAVALCLAALPLRAASGDPVALALPSGQVLEFQEIVRDAPGPGLVYRFRFVAPQIAPAAGGLSFEQVAEDMQVLCEQFAVPRVSDIGPQPSQIIISLSDRPSKFGVADPDVTQYFEAYTVEDGRCIWEMF